MEAEVGLHMAYLDHSQKIHRPERALGGTSASPAGIAAPHTDIGTASAVSPQPASAGYRSTARVTPILAYSADLYGAGPVPLEPLVAVSTRGGKLGGVPFPAPANGITILIVENEESNRTLMEKILGFAGYRCMVACNGQEAVEMFDHERPDLILTDISMPVMDGYEATAAIRARPDGATVPIVAVTAHAMAGDRERAIEQGCTGYLAKPYRTRELLDVVERLLNKGSN
jgi:two-component system cell cycle response regulator DivK